MLRKNARFDPFRANLRNLIKFEEKSFTGKGIRPDNHNPIYFYL